MKARAANEAVIVATTVEDTTPILEEVAQKVVEEIAVETAAPVTSKKTTKKRSTRKTATTKKK
jgi:predicted dinucleotide-binding enzyme